MPSTILPRRTACRPASRDTSAARCFALSWRLPSRSRRTRSSMSVSRAIAATIIPTISPPWYPHKAAITAVGLDDASFLSALYPGLRFVRADGRDLPFAQASFDYVHSSAVIEHVGERQKQMRFLSEAWRVARKGIFVTTPTRWFPVEFHTVLPLLHWAPPRLYRSLLASLGREFFACESNLNLLSRRDLAQLAAEVGIAGGNIAKIVSVALCGWPTNLLLSARKSAS